MAGGEWPWLTISFTIDRLEKSSIATVKD